MRIFISFILCSAFYSAFSCNYNVVGTFDGANYSVWTAPSNTVGVFSQEATVVNSGTHALKAVVNTASAWAMRIYPQCFQVLQKDSIYEVSFWVNGTVGTNVKIVLQHHDAINPVEISNQTYSIAQTGWHKKTVALTSNNSYTNGKIKFVFPDVATYYIDDVTVDEKSPESATFIAPNNSKIHFSGAATVKLSNTKAVLYRFPENYARSTTKLTTPYVSWSDSSKAAASSGISVDFKTNSKNIKIHFAENTVTTGGVANLAFAVYKNGNLYQTLLSGDDNYTISINETQQESNIWRITLPSFAQVDFTGLEIDASATLEDLPIDNRKVYVAIGNSITHGNGQTNFSTHLTYPWQVADSLGFHLYNWGIGGSKINELVFNNFAQSGISPHVVTVLWGYNDFNCPSANCNTGDYIKNNTLVYYKNLMTNLSNTFPNAIIMGILPTFSTTPDKSAIRSLNYLRAEQEKVLQELMLTNNNVCYFNGADYTNASHLVDAVHLNDAGATAIANRIIGELLNKNIPNVTMKHILVNRSEYEKVGDIMYDLQDESEGYINYSIIGGNTGSYFKINANSGVIAVNNVFPDIANQVDSIVLTVKAGPRNYKVKIVDAFDYFIAIHPQYTRLNVHQNLALAGSSPYAVYHNVWGKGSAVADNNFRMSSMVHPDSPDSTVFIWDTPEKASTFGGESVWSYLNILWGNRYNQRNDLSEFPVRLGDLQALDFEFDVEQLFGTQTYKIASNQFFTKESSLVPFSSHKGDFFMVFDQVGNFIPSYADYFSDTTILGKPFAMMHDSTGTIENVQGYQLRRVIIKNNEKLLQGKIDFKELYNSFTSRGFLDKDLYFPNIQFGIEVTEGWGAVRINQCKFTPQSALTTSIKEESENDIVFANLAKESIYLGQNEAQYSLYNMQGQLLQLGFSNQFAVNNLSTGMYLLFVNGKAYKIIIE